MEDSAKYLIHADVTADGVVERSDVVGAIFGQTEGLLGEELDLRYLQETSKVGRIDVDVESEGGRSFGEVTIATSLDRVETAVLAAALETLSRVGPCRAELRVTGIEDVRAAKRRQVIDRAKELLADAFDESAASSEDILEEVRRAVRVEDITEYEGLPAGPRVGDGDAVIVVEGRADVLQLLQYGIKNAVAVEGTDVPDAVAALTEESRTTAFLDGDRGGDLILRELGQVGDVDFVALPPPNRSVEDLTRREVMDALRDKVPFDAVEDGEAEPAVPTDGGTPGAATVPGDAAEFGGGAEDADGGGIDATDVAEAVEAAAAEAGVAGAETGGRGTDDAAHGGAEPDAPAGADGAVDERGGPVESDDELDDTGGPGAEGSDAGQGDAGESAEASEEPEADDDPAAAAPATLQEHVEAVVAGGSGTVRLLDGEFGVLATAPADEAFETVEGAEVAPATVVLDGTVSQRLLDVAAQRGVGRVIGREAGDFVKQPSSVRVLTADQLLA